METYLTAGIASMALPIICIVVTLCVNWRPVFDLEPRKAHRAERAAA